MDISKDFSSLKGKTIIQVLPALETGGVERGVLEVAEALVDAGARSVVISRGGTLVDQLTKEGSLHIPLPMQSKNPFTLLRNARVLKEIFMTYSADVVHVRSRAPALSTKIACAATMVPMITTFHGAYGIRGFMGLKKVYNAQMLKGKFVLAPSQYIADHLITHYGVDPSLIHIVTEGADCDLFNPDKVSTERITSLRNAWGLPLNSQTPSQKQVRALLFMLPGRLTAWKGHIDFLEAIAPYRDKNFLALFVGDDQGRTDYTALIQRKAQELGLSEKILLTGNCNDMPAAFMLADVVVSASQKAEAFGRVIAEAGAMGKPVLATAHGGACEIINPGVTGWLVDVPKATSPQIVTTTVYPPMTKVLGSLLSRAHKNYGECHHQLSAMGQAARARIVGNFNLDGFKEKSLMAYVRALHPQIGANTEYA